VRRRAPVRRGAAWLARALWPGDLRGYRYVRVLVLHVAAQGCTHPAWIGRPAATGAQSQAAGREPAPGGRRGDFCATGTSRRRRPSCAAEAGS
jgi:hypothetical protein